MSLSNLCKTVIMAGALVVFAAGAQAAIVGVSGDGMMIAPPASVEDDHAANQHQTLQLGFDERQSVTLGADLAVDGGIISAGTTVSSHMILFNTDGTDRASALAEWTFDGVILGVMSDAGGTLEAASNAILGLGSVIYPGAFPARGFEGRDYYSVVGASLEVLMEVTEPGDWIRVVTASRDVPAPESMLLFGLGLLGLGLYGRRRRSA
ncbi:PEP-CTERM sorting domain-containing protein [Aestuariispira insulae]|uniref:Putative secreted protein with PEP-CTERM sorting signal n=1 Tax=Aestuariispira insulae TaxID=1461337 RepID=A0A3D9H8G0_9PROT|nr:PEP-CTERM sorting domain-containing protein [Aestuariispira insulae]RED45773.1 putative secreted protein with PEP-CTERM sorting signal [Aestuariispira insulae]